MNETGRLSKRTENVIRDVLLKCSKINYIEQQERLRDDMVDISNYKIPENIQKNLFIGEDMYNSSFFDYSVKEDLVY